MSPSCPINYNVRSEFLSMASRPRGPKSYSLSTFPCSLHSPVTMSTHLPCCFTSCLSSPYSFCPKCLSSFFLPGELLLYLQTPNHLLCETHSLPSRQKIDSSTVLQRQGQPNSHWYWLALTPILGFPGGSAGKESACNAGDLGSIPGLGRSPGEGKGYPLQHSGLENSTDCIVRALQRVGHD